MSDRPELVRWFVVAILAIAAYVTCGISLPDSWMSVAKLSPLLVLICYSQMRLWRLS